MNKKKQKNNIEIISSVLFLLVILSSIFVVNIYAKYFERDEQQDSATVASFGIDVDVVDGNTQTQILDYEMTPGYKILLDVNFKGSTNDVKVSYNIMLYTLDNLPLEITYDGNDIKSTGISGTLNPHESLLIEDIQIEWPIDILDYKYSGEIDLITVVVEIVQVD